MDDEAVSTTLFGVEPENYIVIGLVINILDFGWQLHAFGT